MPEWLIILLCMLGNGLVAVIVQHWAYNRGYKDGMADSLEISCRLDEIMRDIPRESPPFTLPS